MMCWLKQIAGLLQIAEKKRVMERTSDSVKMMLAQMLVTLMKKILK